MSQSHRWPRSIGCWQAGQVVGSPDRRRMILYQNVDISTGLSPSVGNSKLAFVTPNYGLCGVTGDPVRSRVSLPTAAEATRRLVTYSRPRCCRAVVPEGCRGALWARPDGDLSGRVGGWCAGLSVITFNLRLKVVNGCCFPLAKWLRSVALTAFSQETLMGLFAPTGSATGRRIARTSRRSSSRPCACRSRPPGRLAAV